MFLSKLSAIFWVFICLFLGYIKLVQYIDICNGFSTFQTMLDKGSLATYLYMHVTFLSFILATGVLFLSVVITVWSWS